MRSTKFWVLNKVIHFVFSIHSPVDKFMITGKLLLTYICNFHVLSNLLLIYICKFHWKMKTVARASAAKFVL